MGLLTSLDDLVAGRLAAIQIYKTALTGVVGGECSYWLPNGMPSAGATPPSSGAGATTIPDRTTLGAIPIPAVVNPAQLYLGVFNPVGSVAATVYLRDRLAHVAGLSGIVTTAQPTLHNALTRYTTGDGVQGYIEVYATLGVTAATANVSYTNQAGVAGRTGTASIVASASAGRIFPITLQAGDTGIRSIESVTLSVTTGTAGNFGVTLVKNIAQVGLPLANVAQGQDAIALGAPEILNGACLMLSTIHTATSGPNIFATLGLVQK
jgi:hypothetical protein